MKKKIFIIIILAIVGFAIFYLMNKNYQGEWKAVEIHKDGQVMTDSESEYGMCKIELEHGGTGQIILPDEAFPIRWSAGLGYINIKANGKKYKIEDKDGRLIYKYGDLKIIFKKQVTSKM